MRLNYRDRSARIVLVLFIVISLIILLIIGVRIYYIDTKAYNNQQQLNQIQVQYEELNNNNKRLEAQISNLSVSRGNINRHVNLGKFRGTAYTAYDSGMNGKGITTHGDKVKDWETVAVDVKVVPLNSKLYIPYFKDYPNKGIFKATDTGVNGRHVDIFMSEQKRALEFGSREIEVFLIKGE